MSIATTTSSTPGFTIPADEYVDSADRSLVAAAYRRLECHPHFHGRSRTIQIDCCQSALTVQGRLPTFYLKQLLQVALLKLEGVSTIHNEVVVVNPGDPLCNCDSGSVSDF